MQTGNYESGYDGDFFNTGGMYQARRGPVVARQQHIGTEEIKQIVYALNRDPFNENLTYVNFDEKSAIELLEVLNKVLAHLDPAHDKDIRDQEAGTTGARITEFLKVLGYPGNYQGDFEQLIGQGDKRTIYSVLHWILQRVPELEERAYLARFLVPIAIPDEQMMDQEIRSVFEQYQDNKAEFETTHKHVKTLRQDSMVPTELKKEIAQLEQERDQLKSKISIFKGKNANNAEFQELIEATSLLRKEQEVDARLMEKLREQQMVYEQSDSLFMNTKQRLIDMRRQRNDEISAQQMLENLKAETKKNREIAYDRLERELQDKSRRIQELEVLLSEPVTTQGEVDMLFGDVRRLTKQIQDLEAKLKKSNPEDDKLAVYKTQAQAMSNKKEAAMEALRKVEIEKKSYEHKLAMKEEEFAKKAGAPYMRREDLKSYATQLRNKSSQYKKMKQALNEVRNELGVLTRTSQVLKSRDENVEEALRELEERKGISGYADKQRQLEDEAEKNYAINEMKGSTLEELSRVVEKINDELSMKKSKLAPQIKQLRSLRQKFQEVEQSHSEKKKHFENMTMALESDKSKLEAESKEIQEEYHKAETKYHQANVMNGISEAIAKKLGSEQRYLTQGGSSRLSSQHGSYTELYTATIRQQDGDIGDLRKQQQYVKQNGDFHVKQVKMFGDLAKLLEVKQSVGINLNEGMGHQDQQARGYDRLVVREN